MKTKRIVITGASGFLGSHVADLFRSHECAFLRNPQRSVESLHDDQRSFYSVEELASAFPNPDVVIHLAAFIPYGKFNEPSEDFERVNVMLTEQLALAYPEARWVFASSVSVYGNLKSDVLTSASSVQPDGLYAKSKWRAEQIVSRLSNAAVIRFSSIIGKGMKPVSVVPKWIEQAKNEKRITVWGTGTRTQNYLDVRDAAKLVELLVMSDYKGIVLGVAPREHANMEVARVIAEILSAEIVHTPHADDEGVQYDDYATHKRIGFITKFELRETIRHMIES
jgi:UDP-glucose 4-epimerase